MRGTWLCAAIAACGAAQTPAAVRQWYVLQSGSTFDGAPAAVSAIDVSRADGTVIVLRSGSPQGPTEGVGIAEGDGIYDIAFFRPAPRQAPVPSAGDDAMLFSLRKDGSGMVVFPSRHHTALRVIDRGTQLELVGPGDTRTFIELDGAAHASVRGQLAAVNAAYATFGDVTLVAASMRGESTDLAVGRYDFTHGRGENAGLHGRGIETFHAQSSTAPH